MVCDGISQVLPIHNLTNGDASIKNIKAPIDARKKRRLKSSPNIPSTSYGRSAIRLPIPELTLLNIAPKR